MPTFQIFPKYALSIQRWDRFDDYKLVKTNGSSWRLVFDEEEEGELETDRQPAEIRVSLDGTVITRLTYLNEDGKEIAELRGLSFDRDLFELFMSEEVENGDSLFGMMIGPGTTFLGGKQDTAETGDFDNITTGNGADKVMARAGDDYIRDFGGSDLYKGGQGFDKVSYDEWFWYGPERVLNGIVADLETGKVVGPDGRKDRLVSVEGLRGTFLDDAMSGNADANFFEGGRGADSINGKGGLDFVTHKNDEDRGGDSGIIANLRKGFIQDGFGDRDLIAGIEQVEGTDFDDRFRDTGDDNFFDGRDGDDRFLMSRGDDFAEGGDGADQFVFEGTDFGTDRIDDFSSKDGDSIRLLGVDRRSDLKSIDVVEGDLVIELDARNRIILDGYNGDIIPYLDFG
jgi:hypothetical protein